MKGLTEEILTFRDALESQGELSLENPEHKGDISFRIVQIAGGYIMEGGDDTPCAGCKHILRNTQGEVALIFITHGRILPVQEMEGRSGGLGINNTYIVCGQTCDDPTTPGENISDEHKDLPLVNIEEITHCDNRQDLS